MQNQNLHTLYITDLAFNENNKNYLLVFTRVSSWFVYTWPSKYRLAHRDTAQTYIHQLVRCRDMSYSLQIALNNLSDTLFINYQSQITPRWSRRTNQLLLSVLLYIYIIVMYKTGNFLQLKSWIFTENWPTYCNSFNSLTFYECIC